MTDDPLKTGEIVGIDPGFSIIGWCRMSTLGYRWVPRECGVFETWPERGVAEADDETRRLMEIAVFIGNLIDDRCTARICIEGRTNVRNSKVNARIGMVYGSISTHAQVCDVPLLQMSPQSVKKALCGARNASKVDVRDEVLSRLIYDPEIDFIVESKRNHVYDSMAAAMACFEGEMK